MIFISGPNLPLALEYLSMVTSPTGKGVIAMGGETNFGKNSKAMFELSASMQWIRLGKTLQIGHEYPVAIPIPDGLIHEKIKSKNKRRKLNHKSLMMLKFIGRRLRLKTGRWSRSRQLRHQ